MKHNKILAILLVLLFLLPLTSFGQRSKNKKDKKGLIYLSIDGETVSKKVKKNVDIVIYRNDNKKLSHYLHEESGLVFLIVPIILPKKASFVDDANLVYHSYSFTKNEILPADQLGFYLFMEDDEEYYLVFSTSEIVDIDDILSGLYFRFYEE